MRSIAPPFPVIGDANSEGLDESSQTQFFNHLQDGEPADVRFRMTAERPLPACCNPSSAAASHKYLLY